MKQTIDRFLGMLENIALAVAILALLLTMASISLDAFSRYLFNRPFQGQYEFTSLYLMVILTFLGMPKTQAAGGHIAVPLFKSILDRIPGRIVQRATSLCALLAFCFAAWVTGEEALNKIAARTTMFGAIQFPTYLSYCWVPVGFGLLALRLAYQTVWPGDVIVREGLMEEIGH